MTGKELIGWIVEHHAENMLVATQYRDGGGDYHGGELIGDDAYGGWPCLANVKPVRQDYSAEVEIDYKSDLEPNAIVL